jgi:GNAT superfamily N-acetyltransferase
MSAPTEPMRNTTVHLLADHPRLIPAIAEIRFREWGQPEGPEDLAWWVNITARESGRVHIPLTWVAVDELGRALGCVALDEFDIDERHDCSPWVTGVIVEANHRGLGIGGQLMRVLEAWAHQHGYTRAWVGTGGRAVNFYQKCGWELEEIINRPNGDAISILTKAL